MGTLVTQSRNASLVASLSVRVPDSTGTTVAPKQLHAIDVQPLAAHVLRAHVDDALEPEPGADGGGRDAVLARPGLGDDPPLAHPQRQERLADGVVDLVRAGVIQVFPLEHHPRADRLTEAGRLRKRRRAADELGQQSLQLGPEGRVLTGCIVQSGQVVEGGDQGLGNVPATVWSVSADHGALR